MAANDTQISAEELAARKEKKARDRSVQTWNRSAPFRSDKADRAAEARTCFNAYMRAGWAVCCRYYPIGRDIRWCDRWDRSPLYHLLEPICIIRGHVQSLQAGLSCHCLAPLWMAWLLHRISRQRTLCELANRNDRQRRRCWPEEFNSYLKTGLPCGREPNSQIYHPSA